MDVKVPHNRPPGEHREARALLLAVARDSVTAPALSRCARALAARACDGNASGPQAGVSEGEDSNSARVSVGPGSAAMLSWLGAAAAKVVDLFADCFSGRRPTFGNRRRALVNLQDMGIDIYQPAGALSRSLTSPQRPGPLIARAETGRCRAQLQLLAVADPPTHARKLADFDEPGNGELGRTSRGARNPFVA